MRHPIALKPKLAPTGVVDVDLIGAHTHASMHRDSMRGLCGCFGCLETFEVRIVKEWIDGGSTALCPFCGIDSVIGAESGYPIEGWFLLRMQEHWFGAAG